MTTLPPLPSPLGTHWETDQYGVSTLERNDCYTADQMIEYGEACAKTAVPGGRKLVPIEQLQSWKGRVNDLAVLGSKADRYSVAIPLKQEIADLLNAVPTSGEV